MFGKTAFGSTANTSFGTTSSSLFGANKPANTSVFGQNSSPAQGGGGLFGQKTSTNLFGSTAATQSSSLFGTPTNAATTGTSMFGQNKPSLFGNSTNQQTTSTFGATNTGTSLFGGGQSTGGGLFGSTTSTVTGSTVKFDPPISQDTMMKNNTSQTINTKHFCITAMKAYEGKSIEEVRVEDYLANRKAPTAGGTTGGFGNTSSMNNTSGGLFGNNTANKSSLFGNTSSTGSSLFGANTQPNTQGSSLFGQKQSTGGLFGNTTQQPANTSIFGSTNTNQGTSIFGNTGATTTFGTTTQPQQQTTSLFGGSTFGQPAASTATSTAFTFGAPTQTTSAFGQPAAQSSGLFGTNTSNTTGSLFGKTAGSGGGGLFGTAPTAGGTTFGQAAANTGGGLFGNNNAAKPGGLFGNTGNTGTSMFGQQPQQQTGSIFGSNLTQQQQGGIFGSSAQTIQGTQAPATVTVAAAAPIILGSDVNQTRVQMALIDAQLSVTPYGDSPLLKMTSLETDSEDKPNPTSTQRQMRFLASKKQADGSSPSVVDYNLNRSLTSNMFMNMNMPTPGAKLHDSINSSNRSPAVPRVNDLNYTSCVAPPTLGRGLRTKTPQTILNTSRTQRSTIINRDDSAHDNILSSGGNKPPGSVRRTTMKHLDLSVIGNNNQRERDPDELPPIQNHQADVFSPNMDPARAVRDRILSQRNELPALNLDGSSCDDSVSAAPSETQMIGESGVIRGAVSPRNTALSPAGVTLVGEDYYCDPTLRAMSDMIVDGAVVIPNGLTIGRATYGSVHWPGKIILKNVALDEIVLFRHKEVTVYPDESKKPKEGEELNRPAEVSLERVWHIDRSTKQEIRDAIKLADLGWRDKLERTTTKMGATFKDYRGSSGTWVFRVEHFSKYGLPDDESEDEGAPATLAEVNRSLAEQRLHSQVQRAKIILHSLPSDSIDAQQILATEDENGEDSIHEETENINLSIRTKVPSRNTRGLGSDIDCMIDYDDEMNIRGMEEDQWINQHIPEKRPKIEVEDIDYVYDEVRRLGQVLSVSAHTTPVVTLKCIEEERCFTGGCKMNDSVTANLNSCIDVSLMKRRTCSIGWSAGGHYVKCDEPQSNCVSLYQIPLQPDDDNTLVADMMEHNILLSQTIVRNLSTSAKLRHCELEGQTVAPRIKPSHDFQQLLHSFSATAIQSGRLREHRVWELCQSVFPMSESGNWKWDRAEAVGIWLRDEIAAMTKRRHLSNNDKHGSCLVWNALCDGYLETAVDAAMDAGLLHLASMLSIFLIDPNNTRQYFQQEIQVWETNMGLQAVDRDLLKVYLVMAGKSHISRINNGKQETINCFEGLTWQQCLGIHLWWLRSIGCLEEAVVSFEDDVRDDRAESPNGHLHYQLIQLAVNNSYQVEKVIDAASDISDAAYHMHFSWHLWTVLRSVGYNTMEGCNEQRMHCSYAQQLAAIGQWPLAIFVLSHISNDQCRSHAIRELLERMAMTAKTADYAKIQSVCQIPDEWIASAKLLKAKADGNIERALELSIAAGDVMTAHSLFVSDVAPNAVVMKELDALSRYSQLMEPLTNKIPGWGSNGQIYLDYSQIMQIYMEMERDEEEISAEKEQRLEDLQQSIASRLQAPVFKTPIQRLCMQTIAGELFTIQNMSGLVNYSLPVNKRQFDKMTQESML